MTNKSWLAIFLMLGISHGSWSQTIPATLNYQGRLTDNGPGQTPLTATMQMRFQIWSVAAGNGVINLQWTEPENGTLPISVNAGIFNVVLGANGVPLPPSVFTGSPQRWLQIEVNGETLSPRQALTATGYANQAENASTAASATTATNALTASNAFNLNGLPASAYQGRTALNPLACIGIGEYLRAVDADGAPSCAVPASSAYTASSPLSISGGNDFNLTPCPPSQLYKYTVVNGWACAGDNDTQYSAGPGLALSGGQFNLESRTAPPSRFSRTTIDAAGQVGYHNSIAIGDDGLGLISYWDFTNYSLKVAHCSYSSCTSATRTTLDASAQVGTFNALAIGSDGLGVISYLDKTNTALKVAHCNDIACTTATTSTLDNAADVGYFTAITIGSDGNALISYYDLTNQDLKVIHCANTTCTVTNPAAVLDSAGDIGWFTSITIGRDGLGLISYYANSTSSLKVAHCVDVACTSADITTLDNTEFDDVGLFTSITTGSDGLGLISYYDNTSYNLKVAHCANTICSSALLATLDSAGDVGFDTSITIANGGLGMISYYDNTSEDLKVARCADVACSSATLTTVDSSGRVGSYNKITIGGDGMALISYHDETTDDLKVTHCSNEFCIPYWKRR